MTEAEAKCTNFRTRDVTEEEEEYFVTMKGSIHKEKLIT
jgi:hypothetical protein